MNKGFADHLLNIQLRGIFIHFGNDARAFFFRQINTGYNRKEVNIMAYSSESCMVNREKAEQIRKREAARRRKLNYVRQFFEKWKWKKKSK